MHCTIIKEEAFQDAPAAEIQTCGGFLVLIGTIFEAVVNNPNILGRSWYIK